MKKIILFLLAFLLTSQLMAYEKLSLVERFTNCSCGPCAALNVAWYNATTQSLVNSGSIAHLVYNVSWPSACDPMYLLNKSDNDRRTNYYSCNAVPWVEVNGDYVYVDQTIPTRTSFLNAVNNGNTEYSPFNIILTPERLPGNVIDVKVKILRDAGDLTTFDNPKLRISLTEKLVIVTGTGCCNNGETHFYSISRKMLPDAHGISFEIPAPGDSVELSLQYIPTSDFLQQVNLDSIRVVAFIQDHCSQEMYQSVMADIISVDRVNAAFMADETLGASPLTVNFTDYSSAATGNNIVSWEWDFNNDGTVDSYDQNPTWNFINEESYTVSLKVSDGTTQHTRIVEDYVTVLGNSSDILVVNGIAYVSAYAAQMQEFYNSSACFGNHQVDIWDLFGDQCFIYNVNPNIQQVNLFNRKIPDSILNLYQKVIWIGNSYIGDQVFYDPQQVLNYIGQGGNFILATRQGADFFNTDLRNYCGITSFSGLSQLKRLIALDDSLVNVNVPPPPAPLNDRNQFVLLDALSEAIPIFDDSLATNWIAGFRIQKQDEGAFIYIAGRPYRFDNTAMYQDYNYMINYWMPFSNMSVLSPNGGEIWVVGEPKDITWNAFNVNNVKIELSMDNGVNWSTIVGSTPNTGTYSWIVTATDSSDECIVRITNVENNYIYDISDNTFTIDIISNMEEVLEGIPTEFDLTQNYPNPFNPSTTLAYSIPKESHVSLKIYDVMGREVVELVNGKQTAGAYSVEFDAASLASGTYFYKLTAGEFVSVKKMVLLK